MSFYIKFIAKLTLCNKLLKNCLIVGRKKIKKKVKKLVS